MTEAAELAVVEQDSSTLPVYEGGDDKQIAVAEWERASKAEIVVQLYKGAIVCHLDSVYGEGVRREFAKETGDSYSSIKDYASVYARLDRLKPVDQSTVLKLLHKSHLTYTHVLRATPIEDDAKFIGILIDAHDKNWSVSRLAEERWQLESSDEEMQKKLESAPEPGTTETIHDGGEDAEEIVEGEVVVDERFADSVRAATEAGQTGRFRIIDRSNDLELDEPWEALIDTTTGELVVYLENVQAEDSFMELINLANGKE